MQNPQTNQHYQQTNEYQPKNEFQPHNQGSQHQPQQTTQPNNVCDFPDVNLQNERYNGQFPQFFSLKNHGTKAAIEMKPSLTQSGWHTVMLEGANSIGERKFNWQDKTAVQITKTELLPVIAVLLGIRKEFEGKAHGPNKNKGFSIKWQTSRTSDIMNVFITISEAKKPLKGVPISAYDALMLAHLAISQYRNNMPQMSADSVIESLRTIHRHKLA